MRSQYLYGLVVFCVLVLVAAVAVAQDGTLTELAAPYRAGQR